VALKSDAAAEKSKVNFREIFRVARFSTFATISARTRHFEFDIFFVVERGSLLGCSRYWDRSLPFGIPNGSFDPNRF
jgi:hypothetical protein